MKGHERKRKNLSNQKLHGNNIKKRSKNKSKNETKIDIETDERFADFTKPEKRPPVDMYGRPISPDALEKYETSSDDEFNTFIPEDALPSSDEEVISTDEIYRRLAVVNQPWKDITAQDIFQYFYMNLGDHNEDLLSVKVYLSKYGQEHPEEEAPPPTDSEEIETARWRKRGKNEFKRYFAVCEFKDAKTADLLYKAMRNIDISDDKGGFFDLQFVNDDINFDSFPIRDEAHEPVSDWNPPEIYCPFLTNTKNNDNWDSAPRDRVNAFKAIWENDSENEIAESLVMGSGSEDEEKPTRSDLEGTLEALEDEEEEEHDSDSEANSDIKVDFVQEENKLSEKKDENQFKNKSTKKKSKEAKNTNESKNENDEDTIKEVMEDDRFKDFFAKPGYGIDISDSNFKRTELMDKFMNEVSKKHMETNKDLGKDEESRSGLESTVERLRRRAAMRANSNKK